MPELIIVLIIIFAFIYVPMFINKTKKIEKDAKTSHYKDMICSNDNIAAGAVLYPGLHDNCVSFHNEFCALLINNDSNQVILGTEKKYVYEFANIMNAEIEVDGNSVASPSIGGAVVGGLLFGGAGAIVGSSQKTMIKKIRSVALKIYVDDLKNPYHRVLFYSADVALPPEHPQVAPVLTEASEWYSRFLNIIEKRKVVASAPTNAVVSVADELVKLSALLKEGVITQDEFDTQKKKTLGL